MKDKISGFILVCLSVLIAVLELKRENQDFLFYLVLIGMFATATIGLTLIFRVKPKAEI